MSLMKENTIQKRLYEVVQSNVLWIVFFFSFFELIICHSLVKFLNKELLCYCSYLYGTKVVHMDVVDFVFYLFICLYIFHHYVYAI